MAEIARRCRLSKSTVSRALSLPPERSPVTPRTRERIFRVAQDLDYRPNWRARAFSRGKTHTIGLIITDLLPQHEAIPHLMLESFSRVLRARGYHLSLVPVDGAIDWRDLIFGGHVDGCATINDPPADVLEQLGRSNLPAVAINTSPGLAPLPVVTADDFQGGQIVGRYLYGLGHRNIAMYVNKTAVAHYSQRERLRGLIDGFGDATSGDRGASHLGEVTVRFVRDDHERAMRELFDRGRGRTPSAVVCYSHYEALPLIKEAWQRGLRMPDELSVVAFNDVFPLDCTIPPVTRVAVPAEEIGRYAAERLLDQVERGHRDATVASKLFAETLVIRASCAAPRR